MLRIWLLSYINTISERQHGATQAIKTSIPGQSELDSISAINSLAHLFYFALDGGDAFAECSKHRESLSDILNKWTNRTLKVDGTEPASRTTLELLYSSYELTRMVTSVMKYISKQPSYLKVQKDISSDVEDAVKDLQDAVLSKSATIKKTLGESGWMDKVLDSLTQTSDDIGKDKSTSSEAFVTTLSDVVGEGFMEDWAGNVVESWKDSIGGFSYFKSA
jgi:N-terminal acetyltransferase B complex non-catalytic subunit